MATNDPHASEGVGGHGPATKHDGYESPLGGRYASETMQRIWSARRKFETWRRIWLAVAEAQHEMGLPVTKEQVEELRANLDVTDEDMARAAEYEAELRHDVMAHVRAWGDRCPKAKGIIHLGMTSQDVNDNCELLLLHHAWSALRRRIERVLLAQGEFCAATLSLPTLAFTHYQAAQPTTIGRRAAGWAQDVWLAFDSLDGTIGDQPRLRGFRGATGTQASYVGLFEGDSERVARFEALALWNLLRLEGFEEGGFDEQREAMAEFSEPMREVTELLSEAMGAPGPSEEEDGPDPFDFNERTFLAQTTFGLTGQTYPRVFDAQVLSGCGCVASVLHKIATDIRLLSNRKELDEPFGATQVGSSAMPYKRNPMMCERICGLTRFVWNLVGNAYDTAATQWLERTLDDSANRRLTLPEAFLALDGALVLMERVISGLEVHEATVRKNLMAELPFMATENIMMEAVRLGRDRQEVHEAIRGHAMEAARRVKEEGADNDLIERLRTEPLLEGVDLDAQMDPMQYVGLAVEQTERFLREVIEPLREEVDEDEMEDDGPRV